jgi:hypothetical protein
MSDLIKIASEAPTHLRTAGEHMKKMASALLLEEKRAQTAEHELLLHKLARRMEQRQLETGMDFETKLAHLRKVPTAKLAAFEEGIEIATGGGGVLGALVEPETKVAATTDSGRVAFEEWILSGGPHAG